MPVRVVMNPLQYVPFNQALYFINGDDPAQVAWMKRQTPPTLESKIILVQGSIPEMQKFWTAVFTLTRTVCSASASALIRSRPE